MKQYKPDKIYVESQVVDSEYTIRILKKFPTIIPTIIERQDVKSDLFARLSLTHGKKVLYLKNFPGSSFKLCPGFSDDLLCCNYYVIDLIENCPLECTYCILQAFLNKPVITFHVNVEQIFAEIAVAVKEHPERPFRIGTGEHSDSLALDHIFDVNPRLVELFSDFPNAVLELKTKTAAIEPLLGLNHNGRTVVAWSLNPPEIIQQNELKTASLEQRLTAAKKLVDEGYRVAFHFDPIIYYPGWKEGYRKTVENLLDNIPAKKIAWISLGTLRYTNSLKQIAEKRFPGLSIFSNEFFPAEDGKMKYLKTIRKELLDEMVGWISKKSPEIPLYFCMEKRSLWQNSFQRPPVDSDALEKYLNINNRCK